MDFDAFFEGVIEQIMAPVDPTESLFYLYIVSALLLSFVTYIWFSGTKEDQRPAGISKGFFGYVFDRDVWLHRSAIQDYFFFFANTIIYSGIIAHFLISGHMVFEAFGFLFDAVFGVRTTSAFPPSPVSAVGFTLATILAIDLAIFLTHYLQHRVTVLWHFHSVHHSAEVLTIMTVFSSIQSTFLSPAPSW